MTVQVKELLEHKPLELTCLIPDTDLSKEILTARIQKPGLLLTGLLDAIVHPDRLQVLGASEIGYLNNFSAEEQKKALGIFKPEAPAIIITRGLDPPEALVNAASERGIPLFSSPLTSSVLIEGVMRFLEDSLAQSVTLHGVFVDLMGIGILIRGKSGIGKSECALELISRGFRLVADDVVIVKKFYPGTLFGYGSDRLAYHLEIRGVGIVNVRELFGITAIRKRKQMDMVVELESWDPKGDYDRLGVEQKMCEILGVELPCLKVPVSPGRSVAAIVEAAARKQLLRVMGFDTTQELIENLAMPSENEEKVSKA